MKRNLIAALSIVAMVAGVGWKLASNPDTSPGLQGISLDQHSEHSHPGSLSAMAGIRIRLSGSDFGYQVKTTNHKVPQVSLAAE